MYSAMALFWQYTFEEIDITRLENIHWFKRYRYDIPVFHLDGNFLMKHKADVELLLKELRLHGYEFK